jgi:ABC-2 type transport system permease protein
VSAEVEHRRGGRFRSYLDYYLTRARTQIQSNFQYRVATYMWLVGMLAEPIVYLVVWTTIAEQQGGSVQGSRPASSRPTTSSGRSSGT